MTPIRLVHHAPGAPGLRWLGLGPGLRPSRGLLKLQRLFNKHAFWAQQRSSGDLRQMLGRRKSADDLASPPLSPTAAAAPPADDAPAPAAAVVAGADESTPTEKKPAKTKKKRLSLSRSPSAGA